MQWEEKNGIVCLYGLTHLSLPKIFGCGQSFRIARSPGGLYEGVVKGRLFRALQPSPSTLLLPCSREEAVCCWSPYLALDLDYSAICESFPKDDAMKQALARGEGIRILRQESWEVLCSFILSQNNNIPRIEKMIRTLCEAYGEPVPVPALPPALAELSAYSPEKPAYAFPSPEALLKKSSEEKLRQLKFGFRAGYVMDAARKVASGELALDSLRTLPTAQAIDRLSAIHGVGPKVASCALLFGFEKYDAFPIDVWVKRLLERHYREKGFSAKSPEALLSYFGEYAGIAQQYLFYAEREGAGLSAV